MNSFKLATLSVALVVMASATSFAQGGGGRGGGRGGAMVGAGGATTLQSLGSAAVVTNAPRQLAVLFVGTAVATDSAAMVQAIAINAKYAATIQAARLTRAGPPADSLVAKAQVATLDRNKELKGLLKSEADQKKFDENVIAQTAGRGGL